MFICIYKCNYVDARQNIISLLRVFDIKLTEESDASLGSDVETPVRMRQQRTASINSMEELGNMVLLTNHLHYFTCLCIIISVS